MPTRVRFVIVYAVMILWSTLIASGCSNPTLTPTLTLTPTPGLGTPTPAPKPPTVVPNEQFGITWSTNFRTRDVLPQPPSGEAPAAGAAWDRWPFEWTRIEGDFAQPGDLYFSRDCSSGACGPNVGVEESWDYDAATAADQSAGLHIVGILDTIPETK